MGGDEKMQTEISDGMNSKSTPQVFPCVLGRRMEDVRAWVSFWSCFDKVGKEQFCIPD